jgi:Flp pilus assembly pilin Flp
MKIKQCLKKLWDDDRGQSTTEYILILSVVVMIAVKFKKTFGEKIDGLVTSVTGKITDGVEKEY